MNNSIIRYAGNNDIPGLILLLTELGYPSNVNSFSVRFNKFIGNTGYGVAVCASESDQKIIGFVAWSKSDVFVSNATRFHIEGLAVSNNYRSQGTGKRLMEFVENIAKLSSPSIIDLTSGLRRAKDGTHEFYKNLGYKNEGHMAKLYLRKEL